MNSVKLPTTANTYIRKTPLARAIVTQFYRWLDKTKLDIQQLNVDQINEFLKNPSRRISRNWNSSCHRHLFPYLDYLHQQNLFPFSSVQINSHPKLLPAKAREFIAEIAITLKPSTVKNYETVLRLFHAWVTCHSASVYDLEREHVIQWLLALKERGITPSSRQNAILKVRVYLRWLYERDLLKATPEYLIRRQDFPKLPDYCPRPLSPSTDRALQEYFLSSNSHFIYNKGLWLMRKTGLRIGELLSLEYDCVRSDHNGNMFLKVPLGKLDNERLVPLSSQSVEIIQQFQQRMPIPRIYLVAATKTEKTKLGLLYKQIKYVSKQLNLPHGIQSHQLRHSCATELINSGMSLISVMRILGHKDIRMTLRYAKITQETILKEFAQATLYAEEKYKEALQDTPQDLLDGATLISHLIKWCHQQAQPALKLQAARVIKRLYSIKNEIDRMGKRS